MEHLMFIMGTRLWFLTRVTQICAMGNPDFKLKKKLEGHSLLTQLLLPRLKANWHTTGMYHGSSSWNAFTYKGTLVAVGAGDGSEPSSIDIDEPNTSDKDYLTPERDSSRCIPWPSSLLWPMA